MSLFICCGNRNDKYDSRNPFIKLEGDQIPLNPITPPTPELENPNPPSIDPYLPPATITDEIAQFIGQFNSMTAESFRREIMRRSITSHTAPFLLILMRARAIAAVSAYTNRSIDGVEDHMSRYAETCITWAFATEEPKEFDKEEWEEYIGICLQPKHIGNELKFRKESQDILLMKETPLPSGALQKHEIQVTISHCWGHKGLLCEEDEESRNHNYHGGERKVAERFFEKLERVKKFTNNRVIWMDVFNVEQVDGKIKGKQVVEMWKEYDGMHTCAVPEQKTADKGDAVEALLKEGWLDRAWVRQEIVLSKYLSIAVNDELVCDLSIAFCEYLNDGLNLGLMVGIDRFLIYQQYLKLRMLRNRQYSLGELMLNAKAYFGIDMMIAGGNAIRRKLPKIDYQSSVHSNWLEFERFGFGHDIVKLHVDLTIDDQRKMGEGLICTTSPRNGIDGEVDDYLSYKGHKNVDSLTYPFLQCQSTVEVSASSLRDVLSIQGECELDVIAAFECLAEFVAVGQMTFKKYIRKDEKIVGVFATYLENNGEFKVKLVGIEKKWNFIVCAVLIRTRENDEDWIGRCVGIAMVDPEFEFDGIECLHIL